MERENARIFYERTELSLFADDVNKYREIQRNPTEKRLDLV